jgi:hypothetical protein
VQQQGRKFLAGFLHACQVLAGRGNQAFALAVDSIPLSIRRCVAVEVVQRYQLNHSHEGTEHNEASAEDSLAVG